MRKRMSAKRYLLIAFALGSAVLSAQQVSAWSNSSVYHYRSLYKHHLTGYATDHIVTAALGGFTLELEDRFAYTDRVQENRQERQNNRLQGSLDYKWKNAYTKIFYRNESFAKQYGWIFPNAAFLPYLEDYSRQAGFSGQLNFSTLQWSLNTRYRAYAFEPVYDFGFGKIEGEYLKADAEMAYAFYKPFSIYVSAYQKSALDGDYEEFDAASIGTGLKLNTAITPIQHLDLQSGIDWINSDAIANDRLIPIVSKLRYSRMVTPYLTGFASCEVRNFYDREDGAMLLNSAFLRASMKYSFPYDFSHGSFVEAGSKSAPPGAFSRVSSAAYIRSEMNVWNKLYIGGGINHMYDRYTHYEALARYFFTPVSEVYIDYIYSDDIEFQDYTTYTSAGLRLLF